MKKFEIAALVLGLASVGFAAQAETTDFTGTTALNDQIDDIQTAVDDEIDRGTDANRFRNPEYRPGMSGSVSLGYTGQTGNTELSDLTAGARLRFANGPFVQNIGFAVGYSEEAGVKTTEDIFAVYDGAYYFNDSMYGFILGRIQSDGLAVAATDTKQDGYLGFGPGYRIINTEQMTLRVQAGVGQSYLEDGTGASTSEIGYIVSSRFFYAFNPNVFLSNDTDVLKTNSSLRANNDFGLNIKMSDKLSTRISYLTEYDDSRAIRSDNSVGFALVMGF